MEKGASGTHEKPRHYGHLVPRRKPLDGGDLGWPCILAVFSLCFATAFLHGARRNVPIYEYACRSCEHQFETIQKASEEPLRDCPKCGESALRKLLSAPVFRFKGSGWYETDFKTGDKRNVTDGAEASGNGDSADKPSTESTEKGSSSTSAAGADSSSKDQSNGKRTEKSDSKPSSASGGTSAPDAG